MSDNIKTALEAAKLFILKYPSDPMAVPMLRLIDEARSVQPARSQVDGGWMGIESAPRDGTRIQLNGPDGIEIGRWSEPWHRSEHEHAGYNCYDWITYTYPEGWRSEGGSYHPAYKGEDKFPGGDGVFPAHWQPLHKSPDVPAVKGVDHGN